MKKMKTSFYEMNHLQMVDFVNYDIIMPVPRNIIYGLHNVYTAIKQNPNCTTQMLQGVLQQLRRIYMLTTNSNEPMADYERLINNLERWVVQWTNRGLIDDEIRELRPVFETTLDWRNENNLENNTNLRDEYIRNIHLIADPNTSQMN